MIPTIGIANGNTGSITMFEGQGKIACGAPEGQFSQGANARFMDFRNALN